MRQLRASGNLAKEALMEDDRFRTLFENSADAQFLAEGDIFVDCNRAALKMLGCSQKADIMGHHPHEFLPPTQPDGQASLDKAREMLTIALAKGSPRFECVHRRADGTDFPAEISLTALSVNGKLLVHGTVRDVTDRDRSQRALRASEASFKQLFDGVNDGISLRDARTFELVDANRRFCEMYGYTLEELRRLPLGGLGEGESIDGRRKRLTAHYAQVVKGASGLLELETKGKDGTVYWTELNVTRIAIGTRECLLSVVRDITERKMAEKALRRSEEAAVLLARETGVIAEIGRIISSSLDIEEVYERFAEAVRKLIPFDRILVNIVNQQEGTLTTAYTAGMEMMGRKKGVTFPIAETVTEEMMRTGAPVLFHPESIEEVRNRFPGLVPAFREGLRTRLSLLLIARGEVIGSLALWSKQEKAYGEREIRLAQGVASQIASAIANVQLFRERKWVEEALRESEESYRSLVETSPDAIFLHEEGRFVYLNPAAVRLYAAGSAEELHGKNALDFIHPDDREKIKNRRYLIKATGVPVSLKEMRIVRPDGSTVNVEMNAGVSSYRGKKVIQVIQRDITERKKAEQALRESEERYRTAIESSNDGVVVTREGRHVYVNQRFLEMFGYDGPEEILGTPVADARHVHPEDRERIAEIVRRRQAGEATSSRYEHRAVYKDGRVLHMEASAARIVYQGAPASLSYLRDITERKQAEEALRKGESTLRSVISASPVGIALNIPDRHIVWVNEAMVDICGYTTDELRSQSVRILYETDEEFSRVREVVYSSAQQGGGKGIETRWRRKDGEIRDVQLNVAWLDRGEMSCGYVFITADITERKHTEEKIRASLKEKEVLLQEIHHRVKNNLQIISSLLFLQASRTEHPGAVSALQESRNRIKSMALIHEKVYASPDLASVDMGEYTRSLVSHLQHSLMTGDGSVRLTLNLEDIPLGPTEAIPCGLIINELVSNALKHAFPKGNEGEITIQMQRENTNQITLTVSDNGIGLPEQVDFRKSPSLGLTLINSLVEQLGGAIELDRSRGTALTITFNVGG